MNLAGDGTGSYGIVSDLVGRVDATGDPLIAAIQTLSELGAALSAEDASQVIE